MSDAHSLDQYFCQRCQTMGCEKVLDMNTIKELEAERDALIKAKNELLQMLENRQKRMSVYREALEKIANHTAYWMMGRTTAEQALQDREDA